MAIFREQYIIRGKTVTIRNAEPEDAPALIEHIRAIDEETDFLMREPGEFDMTEAQGRDFVQRCKEQDFYRFAVVEINGAIVGACRTVQGTRVRYRHMAEIGFAIRKAYWGMGLGRLLIRTSVEWLRGRGVERLELTVDTRNLRAISLYQRYGFVVEGRAVHERKLPDGSYRDAYYMALDLRPTE